MPSKMRGPYKFTSFDGDKQWVSLSSLVVYEPNRNEMKCITTLQL